MKKFLILFLSIATFISCSDDDDASTNTSEAILGTWYVVEINNVENLIPEVGECNQNSFITFNADNTANSEFYDEIDGECELESSNNANWSKDGEDYTFDLPIYDLGEQRGRVEFSENADQFTFYPELVSGQNGNIVFEKR